MLRKLFTLLGIALPLLIGFCAEKQSAQAQVATPFSCPSNSPGPGQGGFYYCTIDAQGNLHVVVSSMPPVTFTQATAAPPKYITVNTNVVIKNAPGILIAVANISTSAQPAGECDIFDNASTNSGNIMFAENGMGPMQVITMNFVAANGMVIKCAAAPTGALLVEYQ